MAHIAPHFAACHSKPILSVQLCYLGRADDLRPFVLQIIALQNSLRKRVDALQEILPIGAPSMNLRRQIMGLGVFEEVQDLMLENGKQDHILQVLFLLHCMAFVSCVTIVSFVTVVNKVFGAGCQTVFTCHSHSQTSNLVSDRHRHQFAVGLRGSQWASAVSPPITYGLVCSRRTCYKSHAPCLSVGTLST